MKNQIVILAGGESSRFYPFNSLHKSFFEIAGKSILERTVSAAKRLEPSEIILVLSDKNFEKEKKLCSSVPAFAGVRFVPQDKSLGQADAILAAQEFVKDDFFVINSQQFNIDKLANDFLGKWRENKSLAMVGLAKTDTPAKYGIAALSGDTVTGIVEKPEHGKEQSSMRLIGIYLLSHEFMQELKKQPISEYMLESALNKSAQTGKVSSVEIDDDLPSLKYPWDVLDIKNVLFKNIDFGIDTSAKIAKTAVLRGDNIFVGKNALISDFAVIEGPAYIGADAVVGTFCQVRGGSVMEKGAEIERYVDLKNSCLGENSHIHSGFAGDSIIGRDVRIGAEFITANRRLDKGFIKAKVKGETVDTGKTFFGAAIGDNVKIGIRASVMPGTIIGTNCNVFPGTTLNGFYMDGSEVGKL